MVVQLKSSVNIFDLYNSIYLISKKDVHNIIMYSFVFSTFNAVDFLTMFNHSSYSKFYVNM